MAEALTLPALLDELARRGLRVSSVTMAGGDVASFTAIRDEVQASQPPTPTQALPAREGDAEPEPDALERFINRKAPREPRA